MPRRPKGLFRTFRSRAFVWMVASIAALARIKGAAALENANIGIIGNDIAEAINESADEVIEGRWANDFPIDVFQTGSGTSTNMNVNEVLSSLASSVWVARCTPMTT